MKLRSAVRAFAEAMERKLQQRDDRPGWESESLEWLANRLQDEQLELDVVFDSTFIREAAFYRRIAEEAVDIANFAMMLWDNATRKLRELGEPS